MLKGQISRGCADSTTLLPGAGGLCLDQTDVLRSRGEEASSNLQCPDPCRQAVRGTADYVFVEITSSENQVEALGGFLNSSSVMAHQHSWSIK